MCLSPIIIRAKYLWSDKGFKGHAPAILKGAIPVRHTRCGLYLSLRPAPAGIGGCAEDHRESLNMGMEIIVKAHQMLDRLLKSSQRL
jgi:hypothetical protein